MRARAHRTGIPGPSRPTRRSAAGIRRRAGDRHTFQESDLPSAGAVARRNALHYNCSA